MKRLVLFALVVACSSTPAPSEKPTAPVAAPAPAAPSRVVTEHFRSDALGVDKAVVLYLPRGYDSQPTRRWPVFYYLHGIGGDETNWTQRGKLDAAADALALDAIVVMPDGDDGFYVDSSSKVDFDACMKDGTGLMMPARQPREATCVHARNYETYIAKDLVGWTDAHYRTIASRDGRAIAGLSMGGFGAMAIGLRHPDEFAAAASHSGAIALMFKGPRPFVAGQQPELFSDMAGWAKAAGPLGAWISLMIGSDIASWKAHDVVELAGQLPPGKVALYFDCGSEDEFNLQDNVQYVHEALTARHVEHAYFLGPGKHDFAFWSARIGKSLAFLRDHTAKPQ